MKDLKPITLCSMILLGEKILRFAQNDKERKDLKVKCHPERSEGS